MLIHYTRTNSIREKLELKNSKKYNEDEIYKIEKQGLTILGCPARTENFVDDKRKENFKDYKDHIGILKKHRRSTLFPS